VGGPASARHRAVPGGAGITGCRRPNDVAEVFCQATRGTGSIPPRPPARRGWRTGGDHEQAVCGIGYATRRPPRLVRGPGIRRGAAEKRATRSFLGHLADGRERERLEHLEPLGWLERGDLVRPQERDELVERGRGGFGGSVADTGVCGSRWPRCGRELHRPATEPTSWDDQADQCGQSNVDILSTDMSMKRGRLGAGHAADTYLWSP
jgi:hypothetical protein